MLELVAIEAVNGTAFGVHVRSPRRMAEVSLRQLHPSFVALFPGAVKDPLNMRPELRFAPWIARRQLGAPRISSIRPIQQRHRSRFIKPRMIPRRQNVTGFRAIRIFVNECSRHS